MNAQLVTTRLSTNADRLRSAAAHEVDPLAVALRRRAAELELEARLVSEIWGASTLAQGFGPEPGTVRCQPAPILAA